MFLLVLFSLLFLVLGDDKVKICGKDYTGVGYDHTTDSFKYPIFTTTYDYDDPDKQWKNPFYPGDVEYIPNELYLTDTPETFDVEGSIIHHLLDNYTREYHYHHSHSGLFTKHVEDIFYFIHRLLVYDDSKGFSYRRIAWYTLELAPIVVFDYASYFTPNFKTSLSALPKTVNNEYDQILYDTFIETFGTSYVRRTVMGGELILNAWINNCFEETQSIYWVHEQTSFSFLGIFSWGKERDEYIKKIDVKFLEHVQFDTATKGGLWKNGTTWDEYKKSLIGNLLEPIYYDFDPITDIIDDADIRKNVEAAIKRRETESEQIYTDVVSEAKSEKKQPRPGFCDQQDKEYPEKTVSEKLEMIWGNINRNRRR